MSTKSNNSSCSRDEAVRPTLKRFIPSLEGVRGYAFLVVFLVHYGGLAAKPSHAWLYPCFLALKMGWLVVPLFFALSGYLITGILCDTRDREGYFKVFYGRRALRIFPLYYLTLIVVFSITWLRHWPWRTTHLLYFCYLQNFMRSGAPYDIGGRIVLGHLWSLAVEEHFYLLWPLVLYLCRDRRTILRVCYGILLACFVMRLIWPLLPVVMNSGYISTFTRVDGIVGGAMLALYQREGWVPARSTRLAGWAAGLALVALLGVTIISNNSQPTTYANLVLTTPLANIISVALVALLIVPTTFLSRICSVQWACHLGRLSYGLYVFHLLYQYYFAQAIPGRLAPWMGATAARLVGACLAFVLTYALAQATFRLIEQPAMQFKNGLRYGNAKQFTTPAEQWRQRGLPIGLSLSSFRMKRNESDGRPLLQ